MRVEDQKGEDNQCVGGVSGSLVVLSAGGRSSLHDGACRLMTIRVRGAFNTLFQLIPSGSNHGWWIWGDRAAKAIISFLTVVLLARVLGGGEFGRWVFVWSVCAFATPLIALPPSSILVREFALVGPSERASILLATFRARLQVIVGCGLLLWIGTYVLGANDVPMLSLGIAIVGVQSLDLFDPVFLATGQGCTKLPLRWLVMVIGSVSRLWVGGAGGRVELVLLVQLGEAVVMVAVGASAMQEYKLMTRRGGGDWRFVGAGALVLTDLLAVVVTRFDQIVIAALMGDHDLGRYGLATRFAEAWLMAPMVLVSSWMGEAARLRERGSEDAWDRWMECCYRRAFAVSVLAATAAIGAAVVASKTLLEREYEGFVPLVIVLSVGGVFAVFASIRGVDLVTRGKTGFSLLALLVGAISSTLLLWILVPAFGLVGGACAIAASQGATFLLPCIVVPGLRRHLRYLVRIIPMARPAADEARTS